MSVELVSRSGIARGAEERVDIVIEDGSEVILRAVGETRAERLLFDSITVERHTEKVIEYRCHWTGEGGTALTTIIKGDVNRKTWNRDVLKTAREVMAIHQAVQLMLDGKTYGAMLGPKKSPVQLRAMTSEFLVDTYFDVKPKRCWCICCGESPLLTVEHGRLDICNELHTTPILGTDGKPIVLACDPDLVHRFAESKGLLFHAPK